MDLLLHRLFAGGSLAEFVDGHWGLRPCARATGAESFAPLATEERLAALLADPDCDLVLVRDGEVVQGDRPTDLAGARDALALGATLAFRHVERNDADLAALGRRFSAELCGSPNVHLYWSPPGRRSFGWHCDPEEVFLLQIRGAKRYRWRENTVHPWPLPATLALAGSVRHERGPIESCLLPPGGWLYLPAGIWHDTEARDESVAISVGLLAPAPLDVLAFLLAELSRDARWRRRLPAFGHAACGTEAGKLERWREVLRPLARDLAVRFGDEALPLRFLQQEILRALARTRAPHAADRRGGVLQSAPRQDGLEGPSSSSTRRRSSAASKR